MIHELRIYHCVPGRLPDLHQRFSTITLEIWNKHGIRQAGFWTTLIGDSNQTLTYLLEWESLAERERKWDAFQADPEWIEARAQTEKNGAIVARVENHRAHAVLGGAVRVGAARRPLRPSAGDAAGPPHPDAATAIRRHSHHPPAPSSPGARPAITRGR